MNRRTIKRLNRSTLALSYATRALQSLQEKIVNRPYETASLTMLAIKLHDAVAVMKTPTSRLFCDAAATIRAVSAELRERSRIATIQRADEVYRKTETAVQEAQRLVHGDRNVDYGHPAENDGRIAGMMRALFGWPVKNTDVWQIMAITKLSRERMRPKRDNRVDLAGYAEVGDWIHRDGKADK